MDAAVDRCPQCDARAPEPLLQVGVLRVVRCRSCGLGFQPSPVMAEFAQAAACYGEQNLAHRRALQPELMATARARLAWARRFVPGPARLLEIGGATGEFCAAAREIGWDPTLVELSEPFGVEARSRYGLEVRRELVGPRSFAARSFDAVALFHVLEHLPRPGELLASVAPMLRPGGKLLVVVPNLRGRTDRFLGRWASSLRQPDHLFHHTPQTVRALLQRHGFSVIESRTHEPPHHLFTSAYALAGQARRALRRSAAAPAPAGAAAAAGAAVRLPFWLGRVAAPLTAPYRRGVERREAGHEIWCVAEPRPSG